MTSYEFTALDIGARAEVVWNQGTFLTNIMETGRGFNLYSVGNFYVEVITDQARNEIVEITPFKRGERLNKYLKKITFN